MITRRTLLATVSPDQRLRPPNQVRETLTECAESPWETDTTG
jgi:hypothetical protein